MKKVLFVATVDSHIELFHLPYLKYFKQHGYKVHVATNSQKSIKYCDKKIKLPICRSPFKLKNLSAVKQLQKIINSERYDIIHCHTPMGGVVARLAAKQARRSGTRVIYTAHGFHFYKGAPLHYWAMFYPVEKYLAKYTDTLITINQEDYARAKRKFSKRCHQIEYVPGVGVDEKKFQKKLSAAQKVKLRKSLGLKKDDFIIAAVGRLDKNKNQGLIIAAMPEILNHAKNAQLLLIGPDELNGRYQRQAQALNIAKNIHFLGFRKDVAKLIQISDVVVATSKREGLPVSIIETLCLGTPVVATDCRGHRDIITIGVNGYLVRQSDQHELAKSILKLEQTPSKLFRSFQTKKFYLKNTLQKIVKLYAIDNHKPIRILQVVNTLSYGGVDSFVMNIYRHIDRNKIQFDFLLHAPSYYEREIKQLGGRVFHLPGYITQLGPAKYKKALQAFFSTHQYDVVHCHVNKTSGFIINQIKQVSNAVCISHSHNSSDANNLLIAIYKTYLKRLVNKKADYRLACSDDAGRWLFHKNYSIMNNPIDLKRFKYNSKHRQEIRAQLKIAPHETVIGAVGRLEKIKNHQFLLDVFADYLKINPQARLVIVGDGSLKQDILQKAKRRKIAKRLAIVKPTAQVEKYYSAFDVLVFPSLDEGFGMVILEARANGLPVVSSANVPDNVSRLSGVKIVPSYDSHLWSQAIVSSRHHRKNTTASTKQLKQFDSKVVAKKIERLYYVANRRGL